MEYNHDNFPPGEGTIDGYANARESTGWENDLIEEDIKRVARTDEEVEPIKIKEEWEL